MLKTSLLFPKNQPIILSDLPIIPPSFCIPRVQNRPQKNEIETFPLHAQRKLATIGQQGYSQHDISNQVWNCLIIRLGHMLRMFAVMLTNNLWGEITHILLIRVIDLSTFSWLATECPIHHWEWLFVVASMGRWKAYLALFKHHNNRHFLEFVNILLVWSVSCDACRATTGSTPLVISKDFFKIMLRLHWCYNTISLYTHVAIISVETIQCIPPCMY